MKAIISGLCLLVLTVPASAKDDDKSRIYNLSYDVVWAACVASAKENFAVETSDKENGLLTFQTGISATSNGFRVGVSLTKLDDGRIKVRTNTQKKMQIVAWGAGGRIAKKFFEGVDQFLKDGKAKV